jgi:hypothetical protein
MKGTIKESDFAMTAEECAEASVEICRLIRGRSDSSLKAVVRELIDVVGCVELLTDEGGQEAKDALTWALADWQDKVKKKGYPLKARTVTYIESLINGKNNPKADTPSPEDNKAAIKAPLNDMRPFGGAGELT